MLLTRLNIFHWMELKCTHFYDWKNSLGLLLMMTVRTLCLLHKIVISLYPLFFYRTKNKKICFVGQDSKVLVLF